MIEVEKYLISDTGVIIVSEDYMEQVLFKEGFTEIKDEDGIDSNLVCDYAIDLGFVNLGEFGKGFIFIQKANDLDSHLEKHFKDN